MTTGAVAGTLLSRSFLETEFGAAFGGQLGTEGRPAAWRQFKTWWTRHAASLGPASSVRMMTDRGASPLVRMLGFRLAVCSSDVGGAGRVGGVRGVGEDAGEISTATLLALPTPAMTPASPAPPSPPPTPTPVGLIVSGWGENPERLWRDAVRHSIGIEACWSFAFNGRTLRLMEVRRPYARRYLEFDLEAAAIDERTFTLFWSLTRAPLFATPPRSRLTGADSLLDRIVRASERHEAAVCGALRLGVEQALVHLIEGLLGGRKSGRRQPQALAALFDQSLTMVYRLLFLLFAEARGLVPAWNSMYRASYTIQALCDRIEHARRVRGIWDALQAISRLAREGCEAGELTCTAFNGRLFSAAPAPLLETASMDDRFAVAAIRALATRTLPGVGRERISFADLGVEQLGSVYEHVLDCAPALNDRPTEPRIVLRRATGRRKTTGTFYTPRLLTDYLVRRTLHPLIDNASPEGILRLRVLDPAMGSGAFLVAACRHLASAYEAALVRRGDVVAADLDARDRAGFRRTIAQRCLFGIDRNPMAVQIARLSLWLATLSVDRPLTFLDHHLRVGDSLVGASLDDLARQAPGPTRLGSASDLPLFEAAELERALQQSIGPRTRLAVDPGDTLRAVREKERILAELEGPRAPAKRWTAAADLWCAYWFWRGANPPPAKTFGPLVGALFGGASELPAHTADLWLKRAAALADAHGFFHWTLQFPEVFFDPDGRPADRGGFDAVIGNPPWDMVRADETPGDAGAEQRTAAASLLRFARGSGVYRASGKAHLNVYQLFLERAISLAGSGGRIGLVLPAGLATDLGSADLRRLLLERCDTDSIVGCENRQAIFPIHRGVRFLLLTATRGGRTERIACRFGVQRPEELELLPSSGQDRTAFPIELTTSFLERVSGDRLAIPDVRTPADLALLDRITARCRGLGDPKGWNACFGRELNATDDRGVMKNARVGLPVIGGKQIEPFRVRSEASGLSIPETAAARLLDRRVTFDRFRVAYRDVSSATNRLTLIAAVIPPGVVTTHTLFCLTRRLEVEDQHVLCAILNSYIANYLVRQRITGHLTVGIMMQVPAPRPLPDSPEHVTLARLARHLATDPADRSEAAAELQALVARLYGLDLADLNHVLGTFPLIGEEEKAAVRHAFLQT